MGWGGVGDVNVRDDLPTVLMLCGRWVGAGAWNLRDGLQTMLTFGMTC